MTGSVAKTAFELSKSSTTSYTIDLDAAVPRPIGVGIDSLNSLVGGSIT